MRTRGKRWYCIQIHQQFQKLAEDNLKRQDFTFFFGSRIIHNEQHPLFKGYGFVNFNIDSDYHWPKLNNTRGVVRLLPANLAPMPLPVGFVETFIDQGPVQHTQVILDAVEKYLPGAVVEYTPKTDVVKRGKAIIVNTYGEKVVKIYVPWISAMFSVLLVARDDVRLTGEVVDTDSIPVAVR